MELAEAIFRIGVGVGALLIGIGLLVATIALLPVVRDLRALAADSRRLARLAERDVPELVAQARSVAANAEILTEDLAVRLEQSRVQSGDAREDEQIA